MLRRKLSFAVASVLLFSGMSYANPVLPANDSYTLFVGPNQSVAQFYANLSLRLTDSSAIKVNRLVLGEVSPLFDSNFSPDESGTLFQFLIRSVPANIDQVFVMPDAEPANLGSSKDWTSWGLANASLLKSVGGPCGFNSASPDVPYPTEKPAVDVTPPEAQELMMTVCWATAMNQNLGSPVIRGVVYDGQSNVMQTTSPNLSWFKQELNHYHQLDSNVPPLLGWAHGGITPNVDISFAEVYDLNKGSGNSLRYSEVAPESAYKAFDPAEEAVCATEPKNGMCDTSQTAVFPGLQYQENAFNAKNNTWGMAGAEGASIAGCALNPADSVCNTYQENIDTTQSMEDQILQSYLFIYFWTPSWSAGNNKNFSELNNLLGAIPAPDPATEITNPQVVYLFSTQYFGPEKSTEAMPNHCVLNEIDPTASCGIENGFGVWNNPGNLQNFKNLTHQFLYYVQGCTDETSCKFTGNAGIYMYDFIPVDWYEES